MSADNGIYIGRFLRLGNPTMDAAFEYRVIHAQAIENCDNDSKSSNGNTDAYRVAYYGKADVCYTEKEAWEQARALEKEIMESDFPILEYGVSMIHYDVPFPSMTPEEAQKVQDTYWGQQEKKADEARAKEVTVKCLVTKGMFSTEYFVMVQDYPSLTPVIWRGWVDRNLVRVDDSKGMTMDGYHYGELHCYKMQEEVQTHDIGGGTSSQLMYQIEFPDGGFGARRLWIEPQMATGLW